MEIFNTEVCGFEGAIRGMRNPLNSWDKSDSQFYKDGSVEIGKNDLDLMKRLINGGPEHRKFMRFIHVITDICAPQFWVSELDTYKIGTNRNSCSFQHKGVSKKFEISDFDVEKDIFEILNIQEKNQENRMSKHELIYPYNTEEYKMFTIGDRQYRVYKNGRITSEPFVRLDTIGRTRLFPEKEIKPTQTKNGYWYCNLGGRAYYERSLIHRIVARVWLGEHDDLEVNHKDGNKGNNSVENLEWVTHSENEKHKHENGLSGRTMRTNYLSYKSNSKIDSLQCAEIKRLYKNGMQEIEIGDKYGISQGQVWSIINDNYTSDNRRIFEQCYQWESLLNELNRLRDDYLETKDYNIFRKIRQLLPMSYNYRFTWDANYEVLRNIYHQRKNHKLDEWHQFCDWAETLPYAKELIIGE